MRYGWTVFVSRYNFGELIELTSENCDPPNNGLARMRTDDRDKNHQPDSSDRPLHWVDATVEEAYDRAIREAEVRALCLRMDKARYLKPVDVEVVKTALDSLTIGTIDTPLAEVKVLP
jgi:hypothetical protein